MCKTFADPYVENEALIVLLDLMLLKIGAYRHLLFNRGSTPRREGASEAPKAETQSSKGRWTKMLNLALPMVIIDSYVRWSHLRISPATDLHDVNVDWSFEATGLARVVAGCLIETLAFHIGVTLACAVVLMLTNFWSGLTSKDRPPTMSGVRREFRFSHVPLTLIYSSVTKLFLLFLLSIWRSTPSTPPAAHPAPGMQLIPETVLSVFDESILDRAWVVRNILGGMAAGFGLRIILDCHPLLTMIVVLVGWTVKTAVAAILGSWVAGPERSRIAETWLAYSIP